MDNSLMLLLAINPHIGFENAVKILKKALTENMTLRDASISLGLVAEEQFTEWVNPFRNYLTALTQ